MFCGAKSRSAVIQAFLGILVRVGAKIILILTELKENLQLTNEFEFLLNRTWGGAPSIALFATNYRYEHSINRGSEFAPRVLVDAGIP